MNFPQKHILTEQELTLGLRNVVRDGLTTQMMGTLTGGVFLVAYALGLGASNFTIGLLAAIPALAQLIQLPAIYLVEKVQNRRAICVYASLVSRISLILIALAAVLFSPQIGLAVLIAGLSLHAAFAAVGGASWNSWMYDLVPKSQLGAFFSKRMALTTGLGIILSILAGAYIDWWKNILPGSGLYSYSVIFVIGTMAGLLGVYVLTQIPEPRMNPIDEKLRFLKLLKLPFKDKNYRRLEVFLVSWSFAVNLAAPFFTVYMLQRLKFSITFIIVLMVLSQAVNIIFLNIWGRFSDRFSNKSVLSVSAPLFIICILAWTFTTLPERYIFTIPLIITIHILTGIATAGVTLASGNIGLKLAPPGQATSYLAVSSVINSLAAGIAPVIGGKFADFFAGRELSWALTWTSPQREVVFYTLNLQQWDFFFFFAFLLGIYSIHRLGMINEVGEVDEKVVIRELLSEVRRGVRNLSTVGGLRQMLQIPFLVVRYLRGNGGNG